MSRKALNAFDPSKLKNGRGRSFEVVNPQTHYHECHYFYRTLDGELFFVITQNQNKGEQLRKEWQKKRASEKAVIAQ